MERVVRVAVGLLVGTFACGDDDLPEYHRVDRLRILAIAADPPWATPGTPVQLSALVTAPGVEPIAFAWSWCPVDAGPNAEHRCPSGASLSPPDWPREDLGTAPTAELVLPDRAVLEARCATGAEVCPEGRMTVFVRLEVETSSDRLIGLRELVIDLEGAGHENPQIEALFAADAETQKELHENGGARLVVDGGVGLELRVAPNASEPNGPDVERLTVSWFADAGELERDRSRPDAPDRGAENVWTLEPPRPEQARLHTVLRDDRGGTSWASFPVEVQ